MLCFVARSCQPNIHMETSKADEPHLRHVEMDVLIPKKMREKAKVLCAQQVEAFTHCCKETGFLMVVKCQKENKALKECLTMHYNNPVFFEECKQEYIREKQEFEKTGIPAKKRKQTASDST